MADVLSVQHAAAANVVPSFPPAPTHPNTDTQPHLLFELQPVRHCLHLFLSDEDAARLMRVSRSIAASLLADYAFVDHFFTFGDVAGVQRCIALYALYRMRILHICLPVSWNESLLDSATGRSVLPPSLLSLSIGQCPRKKYHSAVFAAACSDVRVVSEVSGDDEMAELERRMRDVDKCNWSGGWHGSSSAHFNQHIPPAALPPSLRHLHFNREFNRPLQPGSIPETVEVLQLGDDFNKPLKAGQLPASLTHLNFGRNYNKPLLPGVLPASLWRLQVGECYNRPLRPGALPPQVKVLSFGSYFNQPIPPSLIPASVTHLRLGRTSDHQLQRGSIPHGVVHLHFGYHFNQPLLPGLLPTSLRELLVSRWFELPLQPGSLPDGLEVLLFCEFSTFQHTLLPGVIPASVRIVSMSVDYHQPLVAGGIPATVRLLRLPSHYDNERLSGVLSPSTHVVWWPR